MLSSLWHYSLKNFIFLIATRMKTLDKWMVCQLMWCTNSQFSRGFVFSFETYKNSLFMKENELLFLTKPKRTICWWEFFFILILLINDILYVLINNIFPLIWKGGKAHQNHYAFSNFPFIAWCLKSHFIFHFQFFTFRISEIPRPRFFRLHLSSAAAEYRCHAERRCRSNSTIVWHQ